MSALLLLILTTAVQQPPIPSLQPVSNLQYGAYDIQHGFTVTSGANRAIGPDTLFDTMSDPGYYYGVVGADTTKQEWVDTVQLPNRGLSGSEQITGMAWSYCEGGYTNYFDTFLSLYTDSVGCVGPSAWVPATPSFADCMYVLTGLPGSGCWSMTVDLSGGYECILPDASNPLSGPESTIAWSATPFNCNNTPLLGPILGKQSLATPGSMDLFEWRDWNGNYFGAYVYGGCYWMAGMARSDFHAAFYGAAVDVQNCYGANPLDTLLLEAADAVENGATWNFNVSGVGGAGRFFLLVQPNGIGGTDVCDQATMNGNGGAFTRQVALHGITPVSLGVQGANFSGALSVPMNPANARVLFQVACFPSTGPIAPANVAAASNGINTTL